MTPEVILQGIQQRAAATINTSVAIALGDFFSASKFYIYLRCADISSGKSHGKPLSASLHLRLIAVCFQPNPEFVAK